MATEHESSDLEAGSLVSQVISTWRTGSIPNAQDIIDRHPHLRDHHSLILDLAYEEYCLRRQAGERVVLSTYCDRFPTVRKSLRVLLATHECFEEDAEAGDTSAGVPWPETETLFLGFYLIREIGRGTFARVFLATEPSLGDRLVVVKIAQRGGGEAETLGRMTHHNIVPVYSVQEDKATQLTAVCMPYLGRGTLLKAIDTAYASDSDGQRDSDAKPDSDAKRGNLFIEIGQQESILDAIPKTYTTPDPLLERASLVDGAVHIIAQLADALDHAHKAGICHRDLKPSNVLLAPSGHPLLLDFNLSSDERIKRTLIGGTLPYMPPQQLQGVLVEDVEEPNLGDARADIFSLGVMLYELLTGKLPFGNQHPGEEANVAAFRIMAHQEEGCEPLALLNPDVDRQLVAIVEKCLQLEPEDRFQTASELAGQLRDRLTHAARLKRWAHRRRFLLMSTAAGLGAVAAAAGIGLAMRPPYAQRQYLAGIRAFDQGDLPRAVACFTDAQIARPDAYQPLLASGQILVEMKKYAEAAAQFEKSYKLHPDGLTAAWTGYAFQLKRNNVPAGLYYPRALKRHGYETAAIWNNFGYAYRSRDQFQTLAIEYLTRAIQLDPDCQAAYLNRAVAYANQIEKVAPDGTLYSQLALEDAQFATTLEPDKALAYFSVAMVHWMHNHTAERQQVILENLRLALDHGYDRKKLLKKSGFKHELIAPLEDYHPSGSPAKPTSTEPLLIAPPHAFPPLDA